MDNPNPEKPEQKNESSNESGKSERNERREDHYLTNLQLLTQQVKTVSETSSLQNDQIRSTIASLGVFFEEVEATLELMVDRLDTLDELTTRLEQVAEAQVRFSQEMGMDVSGANGQQQTSQQNQQA